MGVYEKNLRLVGPYYYEKWDAGEGLIIAECVLFSLWLFVGETLRFFVWREFMEC